MAGIGHPQFYCCLNERGSLETCLVTEGVCGACHVMFSLEDILPQKRSWLKVARNTPIL